MKTIVCILLMYFFIGVLMGQSSLQFDRLTLSLGDLKSGEVKEVVLGYKNVSSVALSVTEVVPQCGCTVVAFEKEILLADDKENLTLSFDSAGKIGLQRKTITVFLSNGEHYVLVITANVLP